MSVGRNAVWVAFEDEQRLRLGTLRKNAASLALVAGDLVSATPLDEERVVIDRRERRTFTLVRTTGSGRSKTMAANVDGIAIVAAFARPPLQLAMLDELLAFAELHDLAASIVFTKADLAPEAGVDVQSTCALYASLGYATFVANPKSGDGVAAVARALERAHTLLIGQSGVGKSSLFRALGGSAHVGEVSAAGQGRQTTSAGRLHRFGAGFLIDSPGVGTFELTSYEDRQIALGFVDFASFVRACRFADCRHRTEPLCVVRIAVADGRIAATRYASYLTIVGRR